MTLQIANTVDYENERFDIACTDGEGLFDPNDLGLARRPSSSACHQGYVCRYAVKDQRLRLRTLCLSLAEDVSEPALFGVLPGRGDEEWGTCYDKLDESVPYTGSLTIGTELLYGMHKKYDTSGPCIYRRVLVLRFDRGLLVSRSDLSEEMKRQRDRIVGHELSPEDENSLERYARLTPDVLRELDRN